MDEIHPGTPSVPSGVTEVEGEGSVALEEGRELTVNSAQVALETVDLAEDEEGVENGEESKGGGTHGKKDTRKEESKEDGEWEEEDEGEEEGEDDEDDAQADSSSSKPPLQQSEEPNRVELRVTMPPAECCAKYDEGKSRVVFTVSQDLRGFPYLCMVGPDWPCLLYSYFLITFPAAMFLVHIANSLSIYAVVVGLVILLATLATLTITALSDPGIVPKRTDAELEREGGANGRRMCVWCNVEKLPRMHHCYECNACIEELDHHCPWTGKCIGKKNIFYFRSYLFLLTGLIVYVVGTTLIWAVSSSLRASK